MKIPQKKSPGQKIAKKRRGLPLPFFEISSRKLLVDFYLFDDWNELRGRKNVYTVGCLPLSVNVY